MSNSDKIEIRDEYPPELIRSGQRGKYAKQYRAKSNVVVVDAELTEAFPNAKAVNDALRQYLAEHKKPAV